jgi:acetoin utilization protein AcuB
VTPGRLHPIHAVTAADRRRIYIVIKEVVIMRVRDVMSTQVVTAAADTTAAEARAMLETNRIQHLVVVDGGRIVGMLSDSDLNRSDDEVTISTLMNRHIPAISPAMTLRAAAGKLNGTDAGCLPVLDGEALLGVVTASDLVRALAKGATRLAIAADRVILRDRGPRRRHNRHI